jgi:hypothetical protein
MTLTPALRSGASAGVAGKYVVANYATPAELAGRAAEMGRRMTRELIGG